MSASSRADVAMVLLCALTGCLLPGALGPDMIDGTTGVQEETGNSSWHVTWGSSETTGSTGSMTSTGSTNSEEYSFLAESDGGGLSLECSVWDQDCPAGEKCMPWANDGGNSWNAWKCSPLAAHPAKPGEPCTVVESGVSGIDDCALAAMCWDIDPETLTGVCRALCTGSEANPLCDNPDEQCAIAGDATLTICMPVCDPLLQECPAGEACYGVDQSFVCVPDNSGGAGAFGEPCEYINECDPGLHCMNGEGVPGCPGSQGCCSHHCDLDEPDPCIFPQECVPWFEEGATPPGSEDIGVCFIPS